MKTKFLRIVFIFYFFFLYIFLSIRNFSVGDLSSYYFFYFVQIYLLLEIANFVFRKAKLKVDFKMAYLLLLIYIIVNSLTLAFLPGWRDLVFNRLGHFISGVIFAVIISGFLSAVLNKTKSKLFKPLFLLFVFSLASTVGVFNEIIELALDFFTGSQRLGPTPDTALDLLMNTLGIVSFLILKTKFRFIPILPLC